MTSIICEIMWYHYLLNDLQVKPSQHTIIFDNQVAIHIASNPMFPEQTKYIEIDCHLIRDHLQAGLFHLSQFSCNTHLVHILTKPSSLERLRYTLPKLEMYGIHSST